MIIERLEIHDYKGCLLTELEINQNLTALIGINGSGKTTILSALNYLKESISRSHFYHETFEGFSSETVIIATFSDDIGRISLKTCIKSGFNNQIDEDITVSTTLWKIPEVAPKKWIDIPIELIYKNLFENIDVYEKKGRLINRFSFQKIRELKKSLNNETLERLFNIANFIRSISYYSATQFSDPTKSPVSVEIDERESITSYRSYRNRNLHAAFIIDLYKLKKNEPNSFEAFINLIGMKGIGLIKTIEFDEVNFRSEEVKVKSAGKISTETRLKTIVVPKILVDNNVLSFNQLSEGTLKTIALLFYITKESGSFLLIEEPEVCVHHGLLSSIIEIIKNISKEKQIIISTHSDFVIDKLAPENLLIVTKDEQKGITAKKLSKILSKNSYKALHEYLNESGNLGEYWKEGGFDE